MMKLTHGYGNITEYDFTQMREVAARSFHESACTYLKPHIEQQRELAVNSSILEEVANHNTAAIVKIGEFTNPWKHALIAFGMALIAPLVLGGIILLASVFDSKFPFKIVPASQAETPTNKPTVGHDDPN